MNVSVSDLVSMSAGGRRATVILSALLLYATPIPAMGQTENMRWSKDPATGCRFVAPATLPRYPLFWIGDCKNGKASGVGILRTQIDHKSGDAFYGQLRDGIPLLGVIDTRSRNQGGFIAGPFMDGDIDSKNGLSLQDRRDSFEVAWLAASLISDLYANQKNASAAIHYRKIANVLKIKLVAYQRSIRRESTGK